MEICTRSLAHVPFHAIGRPRASAILREHFRLNKQDFQRGFAFTYRRNRPRVRLLPIVSK